MSEKTPASRLSEADSSAADADHLKVLGYDEGFQRSMSLWANFALGFTYLSPLVGIYSLFAVGLQTGGPPSVFWIFIVGAGQLMVALVFGEIVSQYPIAGGIYPWARRLWGKRYAWMAAWVYIWALIVTITSVAEFGSGFFASLFGLEATPLVVLILTVVLLLLALVINFSGTKNLARVASIGLAAELAGVVLLGLYLLIFQRKNDFSVFLDSMGTESSHGGNYAATFMGAALVGLFLFYGFEACGDVAEEVKNPSRRIPRAMIMTILVGGVSALFSFAGYVLAAPDLKGIIDGSAADAADPIPGILEASLGSVGAKIFLVVAVVAFLSCTLSLQAAASRMLYSFARDKMIPGHEWLSHVSPRTAVPARALVVACVIPIIIAVLVYFQASLLLQVTAFAVFGIYVSFQAVVLAALRQRIKGWKPAGPFSLGAAGWVVNIIALAYGIFALILLIQPGTSGVFASDWIVLIGFAVVFVIGLLYLLIARPDRKSTDAEGDAIAVAEKMRAGRG
ncbi:MAG: amino acid permease [Schumannella sp.]|nr:amino acid permease [Schumannella sp.]